MKNKKGVLLTLAMLVLFILMLGELSSYVDISISYDHLTSATSAAFSSSVLLGFISSGSGSFLAASLNNSLNALTVYESTPSLRKYHFINNTAYALASLMDNGTIYGTNMLSYMGGAMLVNYTSALQGLASLQGGSFTISNLSISVYQGAPLNLTARLTDLVTLNLSTGIINYPISSTANVSINGTRSLLGAERGVTSYVTGAAQPQTMIGNTSALSGSRSPFMFAYGTAVYIGGTPTCSNVPSGFQNANYILVTPDAGSLSSNICSMGGLVTNSLGSLTPLFPYLVYPSDFISPNVIGNGTSVLLDGSALALLNLARVKTGIQNGYYYQASGAPSYLQQSQQQGSVGSGQGSFSLGAINTRYAQFNGASSYVSVPYVQNSVTAYTIAAWVKTTASQGAVVSDRGSGAGQSITLAVGPSCGSPGSYCSGSTAGTPAVLLDSNNVIQLLNANRAVNNGKWHLIVGTFYAPSGTSVSPSDFKIYVDGVASPGPTYSSGSASSPLSGLGNTIIGYEQVWGLYFSGNIANVQIYTTALSPAQVSRLYINGLDGTPLSNASLAGWWPLNGNANDYSGENNNGTAQNMMYTKMAGYISDPVFPNMPNLYNASVVKGVLNCANLNQCGNITLSHLYLGPRVLAARGGTAQSEAGALGVTNGSVPSAMAFTNDAYVQVPNVAALQLPSPLTISGWVDYAAAPSTLGWLVAKEDAWGVGACGSSINPCFYDWINATEFKSSTSLSTNEWYFMTAVISGGTETIYVDGANVLSDPFSVSNQNTGVQIGYGNSAGQNLIGDAADIQIYANAMNASQVQSLYLNNSVSGMTPVSYWPLSVPYQGMLNQTHDVIGNNNGYISNSSGSCTVASMINGVCGASIVPT